MFFVFVFFLFLNGVGWGGVSLNDILVIGGTVLEVLAHVSPCHSLVQNFMDSVCNIFCCLVNTPYVNVYSNYLCIPVITCNK